MPTGDYATDCQSGRDHAEALADYIVAEGDPNIFGSVVRAITESGSFGAIEIGFCNTIAQRLL
ncbi:hypothetical protein U1872_06345 [Sphingomonas sp. RB3P16]|uniref:hypothetical protein n=1 Tax=Parasphingomonas frigoris TaxID=3096163 RepID=UPI002FC77FAD